jgi:hypothetical protein
MVLALCPVAPSQPLSLPPRKRYTSDETCNTDDYGVKTATPLIFTGVMK